MAYDAALADRITEVVAGESGLTQRQMFGGLAFLIHGNLAVSASGQGGVLLRVEPGRTDELAARPGAERFRMRGRTMDGWLRIEAADLDDAALREWIELGVSHARSLPAKGG